MLPERIAISLASFCLKLLTMENEDAQHQGDIGIIQNKVLIVGHLLPNKIIFVIWTLKINALNDYKT